MKYRASVVGATGHFKKGAIATVMSSVVRLLQEHPSLVVSIASYDKGHDLSSHRIRIHRSADVWWVQASPDPVLRINENRLHNDRHEIISVLANMGLDVTAIPPPDNQGASE